MAHDEDPDTGTRRRRCLRLGLADSDGRSSLSMRICKASVEVGNQISSYSTSVAGHPSLLADRPVVTCQLRHPIART